MKIFIINNYYKSFLQDFYSKNKKIKHKKYITQKKALLSEQFGTADFYSKNLKKLGHQAEEFIVNNEILQKQWAKEHGVKYKRNYFHKIPKLKWLIKSDWKEKILEAQITNFRSDIIYCQNLNAVSLVFLKQIKKQCKLLVGQTASSLPNKKYLLIYDLILSSLPNYVKKFKKMGINSEYFKLGFEKTILDKLKKDKKTYNLTHIGGYGKIHDERNKILEKITKYNKINFWGYGTKNLKENSPILDRYHGLIWGINMYNIMYNSKIVPNKHIDKISDNYANNMTLFEATGVGTMLITDMKDNLGNLFEIGKEIETYSNTKELSKKISYYLTHESERKKIASAGQKRTLQDHTYEIRMQELTEILNKYL